MKTFDEKVEQFEQEYCNLERWHRYELLGRMKSDCDYYLGYGNHDKSRLWALDEKLQIAYMKALWNSFGTDEKPEWLSLDRIAEYSEKMAVKRPSMEQLATAYVKYLEKQEWLTDDFDRAVYKNMLKNVYGILATTKGDDEQWEICMSYNTTYETWATAYTYSNYTIVVREEYPRELFVEDFSNGVDTFELLQDSPIGSDQLERIEAILDSEEEVTRENIQKVLGDSLAFELRKR